MCAAPQFEIVTDPVPSLFTCRLRGADDAAQLALVSRINLTRTRVTEGVAIRFQVGQLDPTEADVAMAHDVISELAGGAQ